MANLIDLVDQLGRLHNESPATIKARLAADLNAGLGPTDKAFTDLVAGSWTDDIFMCFALEVDRVFDRLEETAAAAIPSLSHGIRLDAWAASLDLERNDAALAGGFLTFSGPDGTPVPTGSKVSTIQTDPDSAPVTFETTASGITDASGTVTLPARAIDAGASGNIPADSLTVLESPVPAITSVENESAMTGGADVETDEQLLSRIERKLSGATGGGNVAWYEAQALNYPGVGFVTVGANWRGAGTVLVTITDLNNDPAPPHMIDGLQAFLDPLALTGRGAGEAPPGAEVTVRTPSVQRVAAAVQVVLEQGYSIDGASGSQAIRQPLVSALSAYTNRLASGHDVIWTKAIAAIAAVPGVVDVPSLELNGDARNVAIDGDKVAQLDTVTVTRA